MGKEGKEEYLVLGAGVTKSRLVVGSFSHPQLPREDFAQWLRDVDQAVPGHLRWFSKCWDQVLVVVLVHRGICFTLAAHECVGRGRARDLLRGLRDDLVPLLTGTASFQQGKVERKLRALACSARGVVPPRRVLVLYEGAPRRFLTREDQAPELLERGAKTRLQKDLDDFDEDDFVFAPVPAGAEAAGGEQGRSGGEGKGRGGEGGRGIQEGDEEGEEEDDEFTFTLPPPEQRHELYQRQHHQQTQAQRQQQQGQGQEPPQQQQEPSPAPAKKIPIFSSPHVLVAPAASPSAKQAVPRVPSKKSASPVISTDFSRNGVRVSPDDSDPKGRPQAHQPGTPGHAGPGGGRDVLNGLKPFAALHTGLHSIAARGRLLFSAQFEKNGGGRHQAPPESKVKGQVGQVAPSGLSWEDEIAAQLAAAGVRVSTAQEAEREGNGEPQGGSSGTPRGSESGRARGGRFGFGSRGTGSLSGAPAADSMRAPSSPRLQASGLAFGRFTKEIKRRFNRQGTAPPE